MLEFFAKIEDNGHIHCLKSKYLNQDIFQKSYT